MTRASDHGLTTPRKPDWRDTAACRQEDAELFFPKGTEGRWLLQIEQAKAVCQGCPSIGACLAYALDERIDEGIFGGLTKGERKSLLRRQTRGQRLHPLPTKPKQPAPKTLAEAFARRTTRTDDGHLLWYGAQQMKFQGTKYTSLQAAFIVGRGREPEGPVRRTCGKECYRGDHLTDAVIRNSEEMCGTRKGYHRHRRLRETPCVPCRQANTDADNRLRRTGTTKALAS